ncbi:DUF4097 family beta strand repeat-containing protein [Prauserella rugosa]|uniref:Putative adhesin n=1 Tax=Prauserella rugosa TaxID=43354 RepID=A0A660CDA0_9PSEU|nr:DUF4097 family beta strand repeat-containing protein [Prauserella rugosa]TWH21530.1 putative adhesin [Prauserella rugosa]
MGRSVVQRPGLAVGGAVLVGLGVVIALGTFDSEHAERTSTFADVDRIELATGSGDVTVRVGDVDRVTVVEKLSYRWSEPSETHTVDDSVLRLERCDAWWCEVDHEVIVPRGLAVSGELGSGSLSANGVSSVDVEAGSGDVRLAEITGDVRLDVGSGSAEFHDVDGAVVAEAGSGTLTGRELRGSVEAEAGSGAIDLQLAEPGDVTASVGSGDLRVAVPRGDYRVEGDTGSGERRLEVGSDPEAPNVLLLDSNSGDVTLLRN